MLSIFHLCTKYYFAIIYFSHVDRRDLEYVYQQNKRMLTDICILWAVASFLISSFIWVILPVPEDGIIFISEVFYKRS